jgi:nitrile hydratase beta subunit
MDGIHDLGGIDGFGYLPPDEPDGTTYHHDWEGITEALFTAGLAEGSFNLDQFRAELEREHPTFYLETPYYERWQTGIEQLFVDDGAVDADDLRERALAFERGDARMPERDDPETTETVVDSLRTASEDPESTEPAFGVGDRVVVRNEHPHRHTRAPRYVRGVEGAVVAHRTSSPFPDENAEGERRVVPLYNVRFDAADLWGQDHTDARSVHLECWEPYLRAVEDGD